MNRKTLIKLILCDLVLMLLSLGCSMLTSVNVVSWLDMHPVSYFMFGNMTIPVTFALLVIAYTWAAFQISKPCRRWQLVMVLNALICMVVSAGLGVLLFFCAPRLSMLVVFTFARTMIWCGLIANILSFPLKLMRRKGLVG